MDSGDFPGSPVVKTSPYKVGECRLIPGWGVKSPHASWLENQNIKNNRSNIVTNSKKTFVHFFQKIKIRMDSGCFGTRDILCSEPPVVS